MKLIKDDLVIWKCYKIENKKEIILRKFLFGYFITIRIKYPQMIQNTISWFHIISWNFPLLRQSMCKKIHASYQTIQSKVYRVFWNLKMLQIRCQVLFNQNLKNRNWIYRFIWIWNGHFCSYFCHISIFSQQLLQVEGRSLISKIVWFLLQILQVKYSVINSDMFSFCNNK